MQGETASVVKKEKRPAVLDVVVDRAHSEFISDAVSGPHKLGIGKRGELVDDGGTREDWTCKGKVYIAGKSYGVEITIPLNTRDDIVWRGMLTGNSLERFNNKVNRFGDVDLKFEIIEY